MSEYGNAASVTKSAAERDLAEAIHHEIISPESVNAALNLWQDAPPDLTARTLMWTVLARTSSAAIDAVLARRQSQVARTGPWEGATCDDLARHFLEGLPATENEIASVAQTIQSVIEDWPRPGPQEEDGYPGSLMPPKRGAP